MIGRTSSHAVPTSFRLRGGLGAILTTAFLARSSLPSPLPGCEKNEKVNERVAAPVRLGKVDPWADYVRISTSIIDP